jgi:hypothetical protein
MTRLYRHSCIIICSLATALGSCGDKESRNIDVSAKYDAAFFGKDVQFSLNNHGQVAYCFLKSDIDPTLPSVLISQAGANLLPNRQSNREVVTFNGVNVSGGIEIVPHGTRNFFVSVSDFPLKPGPFAISIRVRVAKCSDLFSGSKVGWQSLNGRTSGEIP